MQDKLPTKPADERIAFADPVEAGLPFASAAGTRSMAMQALPPARTLLRDRAARTPSYLEMVRADFEVEAERGGVFLLVPILFGAGAAVYFSLPVQPGLPWLASLAAVIGVLLIVGRRWRIATHVAFGLTILGLGAGAAHLESWRASTKMMGSTISTRIVARVVQIEDRADARQRLTLDIVSTSRPTLRYAPDRIRATARAIPPGLQAGDTIEGVVRLLPPTGPVRTGSYDFGFESYFARIGANGFFLAGPAVLQASQPVDWADRLAAWTENARRALADRIRGRLSGAEGEIAAALVAGVRGGIPDAVNESLRKTGLAHILSISGLHMALVAATFVGAIRMGFALMPRVSSRIAAKKVAAVIALGAISIYLVISGAAVAAQRAYIMFAVMLVAILFDRPAITMRNLAIAALIVLAVSPHEVMGPSFQMSFAATAALIAAYAWYAQRKHAGGASAAAPGGRGSALLRKGGAFIFGLAMTSIIAGAATGLYGAWHFQRVSPLSLPANLAAMPVVSFVVMPFAVVASLLVPLGLDGPFFWGMGKGLTATIAISDWFAAKTRYDVVGLFSAPSYILMTLGLIVAVLTTTRLRLAALPLMAVGLGMAVMRDLPDVLVSEDARLMAISLPSGEMALNRPRPSQFTLTNWQAALASDQVLRPSEEGESGGFACSDGLCLAEARGIIVAHANSAQAAARACAIAQLLIIDDATASNVCGQSDRPIVVTKRDLALRGSLAVWLNGPQPVLDYALPGTARPWHDHRRFSREARGMAPWRRE